MMVLNSQFLPFALAFLFVFGLCIGSFLNALNYRVTRGKSLLGRSFCPFCKHQLSAAELIPLISFLVQKGHCKNCKKKISLRYPLLELATGFGFAAVGYKVFLDSAANTLLAHDPWYLGLYTLNLLILVAVFIGVAAADISWGIIPDLLIFPAIILNLAYRLFEISYSNLNFYYSLKNSGPFGQSLLKGTYFTDFLWSDLSGFGLALVAGAAIAIFFFALIYFTGGRAMGMGDVKLGFLIGLCVGWPSSLISLFLAFLTGALVAIILILVGKKRFGQTVPFGPFLALGALSGLFFGDRAISLYLSLFT